MQIYLIYGPQGSGKTTQAKLLAEKHNLVLISAGEISRDLAKQDTKEGKRVKALIDKGEPTPDEIIVPAVNKILDQSPAAAGFVFDGYPRYAQQIESLVSSLDKHGWEINKVFVLRLTEEVGIKRIMGRATLENREDDTPQAIARRLQLYHQQTEPIINYFQRLGKVVEIDGAKTIVEIAVDIENHLQ